jgi:hypothetical protein
MGGSLIRGIVFGIAIASAALTGCSSDGTTTSSAACPAPQSTLSVASAAPGESLRVTGRYFMATCDDVGRYKGDKFSSRAQVNVPLVFEQAGTHVTVGRADAEGERYDVVLAVIVPKTATPGPAHWRLGSARTMPFDVVAPQ